MIKYQAHISQDADGFIAFFPDFLDYFSGNEDQCYAYGDDFFDVLLSAEVALKVIFEFAMQENKLGIIPEPQTRDGNNFHWIALDIQIAYPIFIRRARQRANMTQETLAQKIKIPLQELIDIETYGQSNITLVTLQRITRALSAQLDISFIDPKEQS